MRKENSSFNFTDKRITPENWSYECSDGGSGDGSGNGGRDEGTVLLIMIYEVKALMELAVRRWYW